MNSEEVSKTRSNREKRKKLSEGFTGMLEEEYDRIRASGKTVKEVIWESGNA
ncbi:MAG: hypothetical protein RBG13Loki_0342 [Promethearchaeota archaeon CR_4]|nr:MAG: hypothetical protein RBG13Loki_0342 [Candidatus Lokiarchaeota archaeon CR_4]